MNSTESEHSRGRSHEALDLLRKRALVAPHDADLRLKLVNAMVSLDLLQDAAEELRKIIALNPNHLEARKLLCEVLASPASSEHRQAPHIARK